VSGAPETSKRRRLLLFLAPADHRHRDAACATLAWLAAEEGSAFECYYEGPASGVHYGGGHPGQTPKPDLRGGTFTGGRHLEQFYLLLNLFDCEAACLGPSIFDGPLGEAGVRVRARSSAIASFYNEVFESSSAKRPDSLLVVGDGGLPQGVPLGAYAYPEVVNRRLIAISAGDEAALEAMRPSHQVEHLWDPAANTQRDAIIASPSEASVGAQTLWMAERWKASSKGLVLADPELAGRWTPTAVREGWTAVFGLPQARLIRSVNQQLQAQNVVFGRQQDDHDFLELSRAGVAFQLIDPGRPPFPVTRLADCESIQMLPSMPKAEDLASDSDLERWADERRVLSTVLFWTGMVRELENLYALADVFSLSGLAAGLILSSASFEYMPRPPLTLAYLPIELGGLAPRIEIMLGSGGLGAFLESETPPDRFAESLTSSVQHLTRLLGSRDRAPRGWWGTMDASLIALPRAPRFTRQPDPPYLRIRYGHTGLGPVGSVPQAPSSRGRSRGLRGLVRGTPARSLFERLRPFDGHAPGPPRRSVLETVRDAGFEYAFTKSGFGGRPAVVSGIDGLTTINYTAGRWDGWTPFVTINTLADLQHAERRLLRSGRPGWLTGTLDTCLWAFTGPIWERAPRLKEICDWMAAGGTSGRLVNVTPATVARYAKVLSDRGEVARIQAG